MKRAFLDFYSLLETMALNNKLHTLRACVLVMSKILASEYNRFKIEEIVFRYSIRNRNVSGASANANLDVDQHITFHLVKPRFRTPTFFNFYVISENSPVDVTSSDWHLGNTPKEAGTFKRRPTAFGDSGDHIEDCIGLYNLVTIIDEDEYTKSKPKLDVRFTTPTCINLNCELYNFAIIPRNYGKKVKRIRIEIEPNGLDIKQIELQYADRKGHFRIENKIVKQDGGRIWTGKIAKPRMNTVYFAQLSYASVKNNPGTVSCCSLTATPKQPADLVSRESEGKYTNSSTQPNVDAETSGANTAGKHSIQSGGTSY